MEEKENSLCLRLRRYVVYACVGVDVSLVRSDRGTHTIVSFGSIVVYSNVEPTCDLLETFFFQLVPYINRLFICSWNYQMLSYF